MARTREHPRRQSEPGSVWWQVVIEDPTALSGSSFARLLRFIADRIPVGYVAADDVEGSGDEIGRLQGVGGPVAISIDELVRLAPGLVQLDWGDFFLVESQTDAAQFGTRERPESYLPKSVVTIRAVDDTYFYVYARDRALADALAKQYPGAQTKAGQIHDLDFPY